MELILEYNHLKPDYNKKQADSLKSKTIEYESNKFEEPISLSESIASEEP